MTHDWINPYLCRLGVAAHVKRLEQAALATSLQANFLLIGSPSPIQYF